MDESEDSTSLFRDKICKNKTSQRIVKDETIQHENDERTAHDQEINSYAASKQRKQCRLCLSSHKRTFYEPMIAKHSNYALKVFLISGVKVCCRFSVYDRNKCS